MSKKSSDKMTHEELADAYRLAVSENRSLRVLFDDAVRRANAAERYEWAVRQAMLYWAGGGTDDHSRIMNVWTMFTTIHNFHGDPRDATLSRDLEGWSKVYPKRVTHEEGSAGE